VDDEAMVLTALQRMLHSQRKDWDMEFVESGAQALSRMNDAPFDVIVTDMRMPGMDGAELLNKVMELHPKTARIILSGHADRDLSLRCVTATHQFLSKPCDSESIKSTVRRVCGSADAIETGRLNQLVAKMDRLPSLPALYVQIVEKLNDPASTIEDVGDIVAQDLAMTAQLLKLVNSAFFGLPHTVFNPGEAATYLGLDTIKSLVLSIHAFAQFDDLKTQGFNLDALMGHSLRTAAWARQIADLEDASAKVSTECFVAGMLHDIGKLVLAANYPAEYERVTQLTQSEGLSVCMAEKEVFLADHADVGGRLLGLWGLPVPVVESIALHHRPRQTTCHAFCALTAVHVADALEHERDATTPGAANNWLDTEYLAALGLAERVTAWRELEQAAPPGKSKYP
jgi:HD-like signal output (HDOD) protein/CheY-like chemotaxis protein